MQLKGIVLDNGSYRIKVGHKDDYKPEKGLNSVSKTRDGLVHIGDDFLEASSDYSGIIQKRPFEQGHLTSWETEKAVWNHMLNGLSRGELFEASEFHLTLTETPFQLPQLSINTDQIVFEEYGFSLYYRCIPQALVPWLERDLVERGVNFDFLLVIDSGYNCTWIIPVIYQNVYWKGVKKFPIGGAVLNGLLKEMLSFRHYDVRDEPMLVNTIKESTCFVAQNFEQTLAKKQDYQCEFVLPDFMTTKTGYVRDVDSKLSDDLQSLKLTDERFTVPESFFHPEIVFDNVGRNTPLTQSMTFKNLTDLIVESIMACPSSARPLLLASMTVVGGTSMLPGFSERLREELLPELPSAWKVNICTSCHSPDEASWYGGKELSNSELIDSIRISKQEYFEHGSNWCQKQFGFKNL